MNTGGPSSWTPVDHDGLQLVLTQGSDTPLVISADERDSTTQWNLSVPQAEVEALTNGAVKSLEQLGNLLHAAWTGSVSGLSFTLGRNNRDLNLTINWVQPFREDAFTLVLVARSLNEVQRLEKL